MLVISEYFFLFKKNLTHDTICRVAQVNDPVKKTKGEGGFTVFILT